jgi:hypothetical protein
MGGGHDVTISRGYPRGPSIVKFLSATRISARILVSFSLLLPFGEFP